MKGLRAFVGEAVARHPWLCWGACASVAAWAGSVAPDAIALVAGLLR